MKKRISLFILFLGLSLRLCLAQERQITGTVVDKNDNSPLPGVTVLVKGTTNGTATDIDGHFKITATPADLLVFSFVGMETQEIKVGDQTEIRVALSPESQSMEEVVVIGYGVRKKGSITGSVSTVRADKLTNLPVASIDQALQGAAPGLQVISGSGQPNSPASFTLRGVNSLSAGVTPMFILDGMQISATDIASINPNDIESVNVLKDASSTSIYGARATNGVIIITTKRGKVSEKARVTARVQVGFSNLAFGKWNVMNTKEKLDYEEEVGLRIPGQYNRAELEKTNIDWRDMVFNNNAPLQNYEVVVSGATPRTNYYFSGSMYDQEGITFETFFKRYSTRLNLETKANDWMKIGANMLATFEKYRSDPSEGGAYLNAPLGGATSMNPYWNPYKEDGGLSTPEDGSWLSGEYQNPLAYIKSVDMKNNKSKFIGTAFIELNPIPGLTLKSLGGADFTFFMSSVKNDPDYVTNNGEGSVTENSGRIYTLQISNTADYAFHVGEDHSFRMLLGQEANYHEDFAFGVRGNGFSDNRLLELVLASSYANGNSSKTVTTFLSWFGRLEYNFREKYYWDATFRRDGSSRFGDNTKWGNFWSTGIMWNLKKENFLAGSHFLTDARTSFSLGTQGNSSIPDYIYSPTLTGSYLYDGKTAMVPALPGQPDLTWEKTRTLNWNLTAGFWNRINLSVDVYRKITTDMLMQPYISMTSGFSRNWDNVGKLKNVGTDIELSAALIQTADFRWDIRANASYNKNKLLELYGDITEITDENKGIKFQIDHPIGEFYVNRFAGVNPANGDALWYTHDGQITSEYREQDAVVTGQSFIAPWSGGFSTSLNYKGIYLSAQFTWVGEHYTNNVDRYFTESNGKYAALNQNKSLLYDRWKKPGDIANVPRHGVPIQYDDRLLENVAFMRLKNLMLAYSFPEAWISRSRFIESIKIYAQAQNLLTWTKFSGLDPEVASDSYAGHYPLSRQFSFGLEVSF